MGNRAQATEIFKPLFALGKQHDRKSMWHSLDPFFFIPGHRSYEELTADNRLDTNPFASLKKLDGSIHVALICQSKRRHAEFPGFFYQSLYRSSRIKDGILRMDMKRDPRHGKLICLFSCSDSTRSYASWAFLSSIYFGLTLIFHKGKSRSTEIPPQKARTVKKLCQPNS